MHYDSDTRTYGVQYCIQYLKTSSVNVKLKEIVCIDIQGGHGDSPGDGPVGVWPQPPPAV